MPKGNYTVGSNKALAAMIKRYGSKAGTSVFFAKANKYGKRGTANTSKANSIYSKGKHRIKSMTQRRGRR